eukprot:801050_1
MKKLNVETNFKFELCMRDVFSEPISFSNNVQFKIKGKNKLICNNEMYNIQGLAQLDGGKFNAGRYSKSGCNKKTWGEVHGGRAMNIEEKTVESVYDTDDISDDSDNKILNIFVIIGVIIIFVAVIMFCIYIYIKRSKKKKFNEHNKCIADAMDVTIKN